MEKSEQINELIAALVKFQGAVSPVVMNKEAKIVFEKNGKWIDKSYRYADLGAIFEAIRKPLSESGLAISQFPSVDQSEVIVQTMLFHTSGQFIKETLKMKPVDAKIQSIGSTITYGKRYSISAILGISTEEDDDGSAGNGNDMDQRLPADRRPPATGRPAAPSPAPEQQPAARPSPRGRASPPPQAAGNPPAPNSDRRRPVRGRGATPALQIPPRTSTPVLSALPVEVTPYQDVDTTGGYLPWEEQQNPDGFKAPLPDNVKMIDRSQYDQLVAGIIAKKINIEKFYDYLEKMYGAKKRDPRLLNVEQFNSVFETIYSNPTVVNAGLGF